MSALPRFGGGGIPIQNGRGCPSQISKRVSKRYQDPVCKSGLELFSPQEVPILKQHNISCHIVSAQYPASAATAPDADFSRTNTLRDTKTTFLIP